MIVDSSTAEDTKKALKVVRTDTFDDIPGDLISANEETGECATVVAGETKNWTLGQGGIKIIRKSR